MNITITYMLESPYICIEIIDEINFAREYVLKCAISYKYLHAKRNN